jgi:hypothetical protein
VKVALKPGYSFKSGRHKNLQHIRAIVDEQLIIRTWLPWRREWYYFMESLDMGRKYTRKGHWKDFRKSRNRKG